jgi:hypothetical protein
MSGPSVQYTPLDLAVSSPPVLAPRHPIQLIQATPRGRAAVLRILTERHRALDSIRLHLLQTSLRQGVGVPERDVGLVRRRRGIQLVEELAHLSTLFFRPFQDGRATANVRVLLLDLRRPTLGDDRRE